MSESKNKAEKCIAYLESQTDRGFGRTLGSLKRKQFAEIVQAFTDIIDGKDPAVYTPKAKPEPKAKAAELPKTGSADKVTPGKPGKPAQA